MDKYIAYILLILILGCPFLVNVISILGYSDYSNLLILSQRLLILIGVIKAYNSKKLTYTKTYTSFLFIYLVYSVYTYYYFLFPQVPRLEMMSVPLTIGGFTITFATQSLLLLLPGYLISNVDVKLVSKSICILFAALFIVYFNSVDFYIYAIYESNSAFKEMNVIGPFFLDMYAAIGIASSFAVSNNWTKRKIVNALLTTTLIALFLSVILICNKRGPIIYIGMTVFVYLFCKKKVSAKFLVAPIIVLLVLNSFMTDIIQLVSNAFPEIVDRFLRTLEDGASGRNRIFSLAIQQISSNPIFGTYFRMTGPRYLGIYPHNFFLETFMTFGIFSFWLYKCVYQAFKNGYRHVINNEDTQYFFFIFCFTFFFNAEYRNIVI